MLSDFETIAILVPVIALCYVLPIVHVLKSSRTTPNGRGLWIVMIVLFGLPGYLVWLLATTPKLTAEKIDAAATPQLPKPADPASATIYLMRNSFYGSLMTYVVNVDDKDAAPPAAKVRGKTCTSISVTPGLHTLWVKGGFTWFSFQFEAEPGQTLAFSLNASADNPFKAGIEGWLDDANARYRFAKLRSVA